MSKEKLDIIYEDKNIVVINKPSHMLSVSTEKEHENTLFYKVSEYEKKKHKSNKVFVVHRLDKDTSGIIIFAKNIKFKSLLQNNWDSLVKNREYIAIVEGKLPNNSGVIKSWLKENNNFVTFSSNKPGDGKLAITKYKVLAFNAKFSLLKINILTGRKNQIRVHLSDIGHPIVGDLKYGNGLNPVKRMCLHASKLELVHPISNEIITFIAKVPKEFYKIFDKEKFMG